MAAHGRYGYVAIAKETIKGTPPTTGWVFLPFSGGGVKFNVEKMDSKALTGRVFKYDTALGTFNFSGTLNGVELNSQNSGLIWKSLLGAEAVTTEGAKYKHAFSLDTSDYVTLTIEQYQTEWLRQYVHQKVTGFTLKAEINAITAMDVEVLGLDYIAKNPVTDKKTAVIEGRGIPFYKVKVLDGATELPVKSLEVSIKENVEADYNFMGGRKGTALMRGSFEGTIQVELNLSEISLEYFNAWLSETEKSITVELDAGNDGDKITLSFGRVRIGEYSENDGDEIIRSTITFDVLSAATEADSFKVEVVNDRDTEY